MGNSYDRARRRPTSTRYKRVLVSRFSGEALMGGIRGYRPASSDSGRGSRQRSKSVHDLGSDLHGHRRRQHFSRVAGERAGDGAHHGRLYGNARHGHQRPRPADHLEGLGLSHPGVAPSRWRGGEPYIRRRASVISKRGGCASLPRARETPTSPPIRPRPAGHRDGLRATFKGTKVDVTPGSANTRSEAHTR